MTDYPFVDVDEAQASGTVTVGSHDTTTASADMAIEAIWAI
jgi:hypothetical protein